MRCISNVLHGCQRAFIEVSNRVSTFHNNTSSLLLLTRAEFSSSPDPDTRTGDQGRLCDDEASQQMSGLSPRPGSPGIGGVTRRALMGPLMSTPPIYVGVLTLKTPDGTLFGDGCLQRELG